MYVLNVPVVLFVFKRIDTVIQIINRLRVVQPKKIYIMSDAGRNEEEKKLVLDCRKAIELAIDWNCEIIKNYAEKNRGVHAQIGMGAKWVFEREKVAIFLEDDNLPEVSFFNYCEQCLKKYESFNKIFWICGTNYLQKSLPKDGSSVFASRHLMPCGWASWAEKFNKYYDYDLSLTNNDNWKKILKQKYEDKRLYKQQLRNICDELNRKNQGERYRSWDYHTVLSIRMNDLYGIVPCNNQIKNIGVDEFSTHGGTSFNLEMTRRFCGIDSYTMPDNMKLPEEEHLSFEFEKKIGKIILYPFKARLILNLREILGVPQNLRLREYLMGKR